MARSVYAFVLFLSALISEGQKMTTPGKLFIIGGGSRPPEMVQRIIDESGIRKGGYGIILPMSSASDSAVYWAALQFREVGIENLYGLAFKKDEAANNLKIDSIRVAKLIYITGGDQNRFMEVVAGTAIEKAIHDAFNNGALIAGTSAGAAVMSRVMITGNELKHPEYTSTFKNIEPFNIETKPGLGLINDVIIDQHFVRRSRHNRLISAVIEFPDHVGIGIDESTAILVTGKNVEVVGESQVLVLSNPRKSKIIAGNKLGAKDLRLSIYLPGEKFKLR
jgi:cyanophycinase